MSDLIDHGEGNEIFFDGIHEVRIAEGVVRLVLYRKPDGARIVVARLVAPVTALPDMLQQLATALAGLSRR